jgi:hypothetical protein
MSPPSCPSPPPMPAPFCAAIGVGIPVVPISSVWQRRISRNLHASASSRARYRAVAVSSMLALRLLQRLRLRPLRFYTISVTEISLPSSETVLSVDSVDAQ